MKSQLERRLAEWDRLQSPGGRAELGRFTLEGTRLVERALRSATPLETAFVSKSFGATAGSREQELLQALRSTPDLELHVLEDGALARLTGGRTFGEVLAVAPLPKNANLESLARAKEDARAHGVLVVVEATDPGNVGALLRTALALGARAFVSVGSTDPFHPKAVRTSMGSLFRLPTRHFGTSADAFDHLRELGFRLYGAVARGGVPLDQVHLEGDAPPALVVGSEAFGLSEEDQAALDEPLTIPMPPGVDSLSINAAASVCLYELLVRGR